MCEGGFTDQVVERVSKTHAQQFPILLTSNLSVFEKNNLIIAWKWKNNVPIDMPLWRWKDVGEGQEIG